MFSLAFVHSQLLLVVVQSLSHGQLFVTPWNAGPQASLPFVISQSLLKLMLSESMIPSNHLILCHSLLLLPSIFPSIRVFPLSWLFASGGQSIGALRLSVSPSNKCLVQSVQLLIHVWPFATPWTIACQAVYRQLLELAQTHDHWVSDAIHLSHPQSSPSPPAFNLSQHQGLFQYSGLIYFRIDWFDHNTHPKDSQESSPAP